MRQDLHYLFKKSKYNEKKVVICQIGGVDYVSAPTGYYYEPRKLKLNKVIQEFFLRLDPLSFCPARTTGTGVPLNAHPFQEPSVHRSLQRSQHPAGACIPAAALDCKSWHYHKLACRCVLVLSLVDHPLENCFFDHKHCPHRSKLCTRLTPPALDISYERMYVKTNVFALMCYCSQ